MMHGLSTGRGGKVLALAAMILLAGGALQVASAASLQNGNFDASTTNWTVATGWTSYSSGSSAFSKNITIFHSAPNAQRIRPPTSGAGAYGGVYQTVDAGVGDAVTFTAWAYNESPGSYINTRLGMQGDGTTTPPATWSTNSSKQTWTPLTTAGNATVENGVTVFLDARRGTTGTYYADFDDVVEYHAFVPPAPLLGNLQPLSVDVDVNPGLNSGNAMAEFAISIGGGGYTLGTDFVQTDGSILNSAAWLTDAGWGAKTVTLPSNPSNYQFAVMARYDGTYTQATYLGTPTPEPATLGFLTLGALLLARKRR